MVKYRLKVTVRLSVPSDMNSITTRSRDSSGAQLTLITAITVKMAKRSSALRNQHMWGEGPRSQLSRGWYSGLNIRLKECNSLTLMRCIYLLATFILNFCAHIIQGVGLLDCIAAGCSPGISGGISGGGDGGAFLFMEAVDPPY